MMTSWRSGGIRGEGATDGGQAREGGRLADWLVDLLAWYAHKCNTNYYCRLFMCESEACLSGTRSFCEDSTSFVRLNLGGGDISEVNCSKMLKVAVE